MAILSRFRLATLARDEKGLAAVEFVLLFPILMTIFLGSIELSSLLLADLKLEAAAETAADLVAQTTVKKGALQAADFTNFTNAVSEVLTPLPVTTSNLKVAFASVTYSTGAAKIDWHIEKNGATAISLTNVPNNQDLTKLGNATAGSQDSVIIVQVQYAYTSPISYVLQRNYTLTESSFNRPRYVSCVAAQGFNANTCP
jgi:Flp pilus assembly protein TadG